MIAVGDEVVCTRPAGCDDAMRPAVRPVLGEVYTVGGIYKSFYGLGVQLEGLDPSPYMGYLLFVKRKHKKLPDAEPGWYFDKLVKLDIKNLAKVTEDA